MPDTARDITTVAAKCLLQIAYARTIATNYYYSTGHVAGILQYYSQIT